MAFQVTDTVIGTQAIATTETGTANWPLGTIVRAKDPTYGEGEFIYLKGVASTTVGMIVTYDDSFQTALASIALNLPRPLAIAMSANVAGDFGWYQIGGLAVVSKAATTSFAKAAGAGATTGEAVAVATGLQMMGALVAAVASAKSGVTTVNMVINRPTGPSDVS